MRHILGARGLDGTGWQPAAGTLRRAGGDASKHPNVLQREPPRVRVVTARLFAHSRELQRPLRR